MYGTFEDPYCYEGSSVLKNLPGIRDPTELEEFEKFHVAQRSDEPLPGGRLSYTHFCAIHRHLFRDVYAWAGRIRTVEITKGGSKFCLPQFIKQQSRLLFGRFSDEGHFRDQTPSDFAANAAYFLADLNAIHLFREGNGRTQNVFLTVIADRAGHPLDWEQLDAPAFLDAMVASFGGDEAPLAAQIRNLMRT